MNVTIVIHSVCGNVFLMGQAYVKACQSLGCKVSLCRVADPDWSEKPDITADVRKILCAMNDLPLAKPDDLLAADLVLMGSPTYFGNVSAELKAFMDQTGGLWFQGKLIGKSFAAFASAGNAEGGGDLCLQALHTYAKYMGMVTLPIPVNLVKGESLSALGIIQYSNGKYAQELDSKTTLAIQAHAVFLERYLNKK